MKDSFAPVFPAKLWKRKKEEVMVRVVIQNFSKTIVVQFVFEVIG